MFIANTRPEDGPIFDYLNFLDGTEVGKGGLPLKRRHGFCLETQYAPDSPNQPAFPSVILHPGEEYHYTTSYQFSVR